MKLTLKEMNGLLNCKCLPSDLIVGETLAEYLVRKFTELEQKLAESQREFRAADATIENLQMQFDAERESKLALAAELQAVKAAHPQPFGPVMMKALDAYEKHQDETPETGMLDAFFILRDSIRVDTTATDAFLAEVRVQAKADGVQEYADSFRHSASNIRECNGETIHVRALLHHAKNADEFAAQLRKGSQS